MQPAGSLPERPTQPPARLPPLVPLHGHIAPPASSAPPERPRAPPAAPPAQPPPPAPASALPPEPRSPPEPAVNARPSPAVVGALEAAVGEAFQRRPSALKGAMARSRTGSVTSSFSLSRALSNRVDQMPPSPDNQDSQAAAREAEHRMHEEARLREQKSRDELNRLASLGWYFPAKRLLQWGEVQHAKHAEWQDLYYDLIMVGAAFRKGLFLKANLTRLEGPLGLVAMGLTTLTSWSHLTAYRARYDARSPAHRVLDAIEGVLTAASQHNIVANLGRFERVNMYAFLATTIGARLVHLARRVEIVVKVEIDTPQRRTRIEFCWRMVLEIVVLCGGFALRTANGMFALLLCAWLMNMLFLFVPVFVGWSNRISAVPIHVEYFLMRRGELIMLMLGEGVLQIILATSPITLEYYTTVRLDKTDAYAGGASAKGDDGADTDAVAELQCGRECWIEVVKGAVGFASAFLILSSVMYLYYTANPTGHGARHHHAIRRSAQRGVLWNVSHYLLAVGLIALGVSVAVLQPYTAKPPPSKYAQLFCTSSAFSIVVIAFQKVLHPGWELYRKSPGAPRRQALGAIKLLLALASLLMYVFPPSAEGYHYLLFGLLLAGGGAICVKLEKSPHAEAELWSYIDEHEAADRRARRLAHAVRAATALSALGRAVEEGRAAAAPAADQGATGAGGACAQPAAATAPRAADGAAAAAPARLGFGPQQPGRWPTSSARAQNLARAREARLDEESGSDDEEMDEDEADAVGAQTDM
ncbi:hypothetical protein KFE25_005010 [Diacronema lutheri]|uniref:Uncharacterized protein n=1 Tax=Diacronema lutheri TaxID=2081491 RepID=A0A8J5XF95_DIALT|nr:hypothetical protein KFE25_005010 [Diacronema lutheri]